MASDTMRPPAMPAYPKWAEPVVVPIARLISLVVDTVHLAERTAGPALDLFIRVWLAESFLASGLVKAANWQTALLLATYEYPVGWLDPRTAAVIGLAIEVVDAQHKVGMNQVIALCIGGGGATRPWCAIVEELNAGPVR